MLWCIVGCVAFVGYSWVIWVIGRDAGRAAAETEATEQVIEAYRRGIDAARR